METTVTSRKIQYKRRPSGSFRRLVNPPTAINQGGGLHVMHTRVIAFEFGPNLGRIRPVNTKPCKSLHTSTAGMTARKRHYRDTERKRCFVLSRCRCWFFPGAFWIYRRVYCRGGMWGWFFMRMKRRIAVWSVGCIVWCFRGCFMVRSMIDLILIGVRFMYFSFGFYLLIIEVDPRISFKFFQKNFSTSGDISVTFYLRRRFICYDDNKSCLIPLKVYEIY